MVAEMMSLLSVDACFICVVISPIWNAASIVFRQPMLRLSLAPVLYFSSLFHPDYLQITNPKSHSADIYAWVSSACTNEAPETE